MAAPPKAVVLKGAVAASALSGAVALPQLPSLGEESPAAAAPRRPGQRTTMWSRPAQGDDAYVCEMVMQGASVELVLVCGDRELAVHPCKNMDEAFAQSSKWKRIPDPEAHFAGSAA